MNTVLSTVDHLVSRVRPLSSLLDRIVEKIVPSTTAAACGCTYLCYTECIAINGGHYIAKYCSDEPSCDQIACRIVTGTSC